MTRLALALVALTLGCQTGPPGEPSPPPEETTPPAPAASSAAPEPDPTPFVSTEQFDVLIARGKVVDGTGRQPFEGDLLIKNGRIVHVGTVAQEVQARTRIDARGLVIAPGFIDAHSHADPLRENAQLLAQGVTTIVIGQDGLSTSEDPMRVWAARVGRQTLSLNVVPLAGHATIRVRANVGMLKNPGKERIAEMARLLEEDLAAGAWGLSTALEYEPGTFSAPDELAALAVPVARVDGVVMSHLRSEDDDKIHAALAELVEQGERSGARVHAAHLKIVYGKGDKPAKRLLALMQAARERGVRLTADAYPYTASYTGISIVFPDFAKPPNNYDDAKSRRRTELAAFLRKRVMRRGGPEATLFGGPPYRGMTLAHVAATEGKPFEEVLIDIGPNGGSAAYFVMDEATQSRLVLDRFVMIGTDGSGGTGHPRAYGTFPRMIREYVVRKKKLSLEEAVRKMSGLAADTLGLTKSERGLLRAGWAADIAVFDPKEFEDRADYGRPNELARGMRWVLVNGRPVIENGRFDAARRAGALLLRPK
jgi:N-acyl-D-amino-acid deacylase